MTDRTTTDAGRRYAFAPHPDPIEDILYRIHGSFRSLMGACGPPEPTLWRRTWSLRKQWRRT